MNRFAPSTTGRAHPGTLLAALLCWLDARTRGDQVLLRLEDLDPQRCRPEWCSGLRDDLAWFGLDWDREVVQSTRHAAHADALAVLVAAGAVYPCRCSRRELRERCAQAPDGSTVYDGRCRDRPLPADWREPGVALRLRLAPGSVAVEDESGDRYACDVERELGDPVVRRRDGAVAYHLASVVDDAADGVTRVVRGRDLAWSTPVQAVLQERLGYPRPHYRHHLLLLEGHGDKLSKFHAAVGGEELRAAYSGPALCGLLAEVAGLRASAAPTTPAELIAEFDWSSVRAADQVLRWDGERLLWELR